MSQNVTNNWFQKLGTDSSFLDKQTNTKSVASKGSTFQSFLSQQIKKSSSSGISNKGDTNATPEREIKALKRMDTTASKLAIKAPDKASVNSGTESTKNNVSKDNKVQNVESSFEKSKATDASKTEAVDDVNVTESTQEDDKMTDLSEVAPELLQMIQALPEEVIAQLPQELQSLLADVSEKLKGVVGLNEGNNENTDVTKVITALTSELNTREPNETLVKTELVETLKQVMGQLKETKTINGDQAKTFEDVLGQLKTQVSQSEVVKPVAKGEVLQESKTGQVATESETPMVNTVNNNSGAGSKNGEAKSGMDGNTTNQSLMANTKTDKNVKADIQTDTSKDTTVRNFTAKAEASSIAFGKQEVATQTVKSALHTNIMDQIINSPKLQIKQTEQGTMMTLKLNPEVLGNVEIKMEIVKGVLQAEINVENMIVKGAIESSLADLKNALSDKGYQVETLNVSVGQEGKQSQQQQHQERHNNEKATVFTPEELEAINSSYDFNTVVNDTRIDYLG